MSSKIISIFWLAPLAAWFVAHLIKFVISLAKPKAKADLGVFVRAGGMPSSHSAVVVALAVVIAVRSGMDSAEFGLAAVLAIIVMFDALNVRRAVGEQGTLLQNLLQKAGNTLRPFEAKGHLPSEVVVGSTVGIFVALVLLQIL